MSVPRGARVAIIGAGPAGSAAAFHLARAGLDVIVFESRPFPRVKVCGEFISPAATGLLEAILPPAMLGAAGARRTTSFTLQLGTAERTLRLPTPAWALSRRSLDSLLLGRAIEAGAQVVQPCAVASVDHGDEAGHTPARLTLADGRGIEADLVLHADGHGRHCPGGATPCAASLIAHKCHFMPDAPIAGVTIRSCPGAYIGTIQIEPRAQADDATASRPPHRHATIALVARKRLLAAHRGDIDAMVASLWPDWEPARRATAWLSTGVARSAYRASGHPRALRLGNAAAAVDPVGGEGIGLALWSGTLAADLVVRAAGLRSLRSGRPRLEPSARSARGFPFAPRALRGIQRRYARAYRRRLLLRRPACLLAAEALMHPTLVGALWPLLGLESLTLAPWYAATGKPLREP